jgi:regulator of protease activity HflC (stomatin/prohibitin superfamily)
METILAALALLIVGYTVGSVKIVNQGTEALVERLGRYHRKLGAGLNFVVPMLDNIVLEESVRERVIDTQPQNAITKDNLEVEVDAIIYWRILELERAFYNVEDIEMALTNLVLTTLRSQIGEMELRATFSSRNEINHAVLQQIDAATATWGVKVTRVEVQNIKPTETILRSLEQQEAAENKRKAVVAEAQGTVESIEQIARALKEQPNSHAVLQYLMAQKYLDANYRLSESPNSKVIFLDPRNLTEGMAELISPESGGGNDDSNNGKPG